MHATLETPHSLDSRCLEVLCIFARLSSLPVMPPPSNQRLTLPRPPLKNLSLQKQEHRNVGHPQATPPSPDPRPDSPLHNPSAPAAAAPRRPRVLGKLTRLWGGIAWPTPHLPDSRSASSTHRPSAPAAAATRRPRVPGKLTRLLGGTAWPLRCGARGT